MSNYQVQIEHQQIEVTLEELERRLFKAFNYILKINDIYENNEGEEGDSSSLLQIERF
jgi:hypothetical protein